MEKNDSIWEKNKQPDLSICPKHFCFFWQEKGDLVAKGMHKSVEDAMDQLVKVGKSQCGFQYGRCVRAQKAEGARDFYEPCEPVLRKAGLPDFYFNNPNWNKSEEDRDAYNAYFGIKE